MKSLAIMCGPKEDELKNYILEALEALEINYKFISLKELDESRYLDYAIINSSQKLKASNLECSYCFINMDNNYKENLNIYGNIITYGLGSRNTVTLSSIENNNLGFVYCLQRYLDLEGGFVLEPQDIPFHVEYSNHTHLYSLMIAITIALIEGLNIDYIEKKLSKKVLFLS